MSAEQEPIEGYVNVYMTGRFGEIHRTIADADDLSAALRAEIDEMRKRK